MPNAWNADACPDNRSGPLVLIAALALSLFSGVVEASDVGSLESNRQYTVEPIPEWVQMTPAFDPELEAVAEAEHGLRNRLAEFQYNGIVPNVPSYFHAFEYQVTNNYGVENFSNIEVSFDPGYERLSLHELWIKRGDVLIDKLPTARFDLLRTEGDRAQLIYDGSRTLAVVLDDVRSGDMVRYSYSLEGDNPIFQGHREFRVETERWNPVDRAYARVLSAVDKPLSTRIRGKDVPMKISVHEGVQELIIDQRGLKEYSLEEDVPSWHYNRGTVVFSDMADWQAVVDWALPMYQLPSTDIPEIATVVSAIQASHVDSEAQIGAALRWVQEEIRYFGVMMGKNSHWPARPQETLSRRFGDCKAKALLLMALLRELGFESQAALVNTEREVEAVNYPYRLHAFDHVLVHVLLDGQSHFIDPTLRNQQGVLGEMLEPDYGYALILAEGTSGLSAMGSLYSGYEMSTRKTLVLPPESLSTSTTAMGTLDVVTTRRGRWAESMRYDLETDSMRELADSYRQYYSEYFSGIEAMELPLFEEAESNSVVVTERYRIPHVWGSEEQTERHLWIYADEIASNLDRPKAIEGRKQPYELVHPVVMEESWEILMPKALRVFDLNASVSNQWVEFSKHSELSDDKDTLRVSFRFRTLTNEVAAEDLAAYANAIDEIYDQISFYVEDQPTMGAALKTVADGITSAGKVQWSVLWVGLMTLAGRGWYLRKVAVS